MKKIIAGLLIASAMFTFGCSGRNAEFGVVDLHKVQTEATFFKTTVESANQQMADLNKEAMGAIEGKSEEEAKKLLSEYQAKAQLIQSEADNKLKASLDAALSQVAKEKELGAILVKEAVPQGGTDVTADVIAKIK